MNATYTVDNPHFTNYVKEDPGEVLACVRAFDMPERKEARPQS